MRDRGLNLPRVRLAKENAKEDFFLSKIQSFEIEGPITRRKLVHYNWPLQLGHCDSC